MLAIAGQIAGPNAIAGQIAGPNAIAGQIAGPNGLKYFKEPMFALG